MSRFKIDDGRIADFRCLKRKAILKRKKTWNEDGVASTIGTIMALLVFLTFLGMFTNQYVPIWMKENESNHMNDVIRQFSNYKWGIDTLIMNSEENDIASAPLYTPLQLHAKGVPVFATATAGSLTFVAESASYPWYSVSYHYYDLDENDQEQYHTFNETNGGRTGGGLEFYGPNRYYVQQTLAYENGAIILSQEEGEVILSHMSLRIVRYGDELMVKMTQISLSGVNKTVGGFGTKGITTTLENSNYVQFRNSSASGANLTITINSKFGSAWYEYLNDLLNDTSASLGDFNWSVDQSSPTVVENVNYYTITAVIEGVSLLEHTNAMVAVSIADISIGG